VINQSGEYVHNRIVFPSPLFANSFITGVYVAKVDPAETANSGLVISLEHRNADTQGDARIEHTQASLDKAAAGLWQTIPFRAVVDYGGPREITAATFSFGHFANTSPDFGGGSVHGGGSGYDMAAGSGTTYFDQIYFDINHPNLRMDRTGAIIGTYIADAQIGTAHIQDATIQAAHIDQLAVNSAHMKSVNADAIQAGTIGVGLNLGGENKIFLDGVTGRIIVRE
jgi:hypothetical protein